MPHTKDVPLDCAYETDHSSQYEAHNSNSPGICAFMGCYRCLNIIFLTYDEKKRI